MNACTTANDQLEKKKQVESASSILAAADSRQAQPLRDKCLDFVLKNLNRVASTDGWAALPPALANEVTLAAASRRRATEVRLCLRGNQA